MGPARELADRVWLVDRDPTSDDGKPPHGSGPLIPGHSRHSPDAGGSRLLRHPRGGTTSREWRAINGTSSSLALDAASAGERAFPRRLMPGPMAIPAGGSIFSLPASQSSRPGPTPQTPKSYVGHAA